LDTKFSFLDKFETFELAAADFLNI